MIRGALLCRHSVNTRLIGHGAYPRIAVQSVLQAASEAAMFLSRRLWRGYEQMLLVRWTLWQHPRTADGRRHAPCRGGGLARSLQYI
jgi:hypothetical protein